MLDQRYTIKSRTKPLSSFSLCAHARNYNTSSARLLIFVFVSTSSDPSSAYDSSTTDLSLVNPTLPFVGHKVMIPQTIS